MYSDRSRILILHRVDRQKSRLISLQTELSTYCTDPSETEEFESFKKDFQIGTRTEEISQLLSTNEKVREIHTKLGTTFSFLLLLTLNSSYDCVLQGLLGEILFQAKQVEARRSPKSCACEEGNNDWTRRGRNTLGCRR